MLLVNALNIILLDKARELDKMDLFKGLSTVGLLNSVRRTAFSIWLRLCKMCAKMVWYV